MNNQVRFGENTIINGDTDGQYVTEYNINQVKMLLDRISNGLVVDIDDFEKLKRFVNSESVLPVYNMKYENDDGYFYIIHHAQRLYDIYYLKEQEKQKKLVVPQEFKDNESRYKNIMDKYVNDIVCMHDISVEEKKQISILARLIGVETEMYVNRRNKLIREINESMIKPNKSDIIITNRLLKPGIETIRLPNKSSEPVYFQGSNLHVAQEVNK